MSNYSLPPLKDIIKEEAISEIEERIKEAKALLTINWINYDDQFGAAINELQAWRDITLEVLAKIFEEDSVADGFSDRFGSVGIGSDKWSWYDREVRREIHKLETIKRRISSIPDKKREAYPAKKISKVNQPIWKDKKFVIGLIVVPLIVALIGFLGLIFNANILKSSDSSKAVQNNTSTQNQQIQNKNNPCSPAIEGNNNNIYYNGSPCNK